MMLFNKTEGLFCHRTQEESLNSAEALYRRPLQIHSYLPVEVAVQKGVLPRSSSQVSIKENEARVLSAKNATLVLFHPDLKPVSLDGKTISAAADSQEAMSVELTQGWHSIGMQKKNDKSDNI